jgi:Rsm1-like
MKRAAFGGFVDATASHYLFLPLIFYITNAPNQIETIYRLPLASPPVSLAALSARYVSLISMAGDLPSNLSAPDDLDTLRLAKQVPIEFLLPYLPSSSAAESLQGSDAALNHEAFVLALFGWQAETGHIAGLATCEACFRRLGLWLFKAKTPEDASMSRLDVIGEHRDYCPWVNSLSQNGGGSSKNSNTDSSDHRAGWEVLLRALKGALHLYSQSGNAAAPLSSPKSNTSDATYEANNTTDQTEKAASMMSRDEQDKERWARLKKLKKVFEVRNRRKGAVRATPRPESSRGIHATQVAQSNE